jgi:signal transduction histidine kinase
LLHNSFSFRLGLLYLLLFIVSSFILFSFIYFASTRSLEQQLTTSLETEARIFDERYAQFGINGVIRLLAFRAQSQAKLGVYALSDSNNDILAGTVDRWPHIKQDTQSTELTLSFGEDKPAQVFVSIVSILDSSYKLLIGKSKEDIKRIQRRLINTFLSASLITLALGLLGGIWLSKRAVRRIEKINSLVNTTIQGDLTQRLSVPEPIDDLDHLSVNINAMLDRIQTLMADVAGVTNNIAHDLRTPLSHLRLQLEQLQETELSTEQSKEQIALALNSTDHILDTFNALLRISKIESTKRRESFTQVHLPSLVGDVIELYEPLAEDRQQPLTVSHCDDVTLHADRNLLFQALSNLVDNAIKHTATQTQISVSLSSHSKNTILTVCDHGEGVDDSEKVQLSRRFYRTDKSRSTGGNGLGLSLVAAVAKLHNAELRFADNRPGLCVSLHFKAPITD